MRRAALFTLVGVVLCARSLQSFADPEFQDPVSAADWFSVLSFSVGLLALALALPSFARMVGGRWVFRVSLVPAAGAALAGVANILEDGLQLGFAFWLFIVGGALILPGLAVFTLVVAFAGRGRTRLYAAVPAATLVGMGEFESGGGILILAAWLAAAVLAARSPTSTADHAELEAT